MTSRKNKVKIEITKLKVMMESILLKMVLSRRVLITCYKTSRERRELGEREGGTKRERL